MRIRALWLLAPSLLWVVATGCFWSSLERRTITIDGFRSWWDQPLDVPPSALIPARVPVGIDIPEVASGEVVGIEEILLFVQLQNAGFSSVEVAVYAHPDSLGDLDRVRREGVRILRPVLIQAQSALQIDARSYPTLATDLDRFEDLILAGDFHLYVVGESEPFRVGAAAPALSVLVTLE
jgi:hypothetical protein